MSGALPNLEERRNAVGGDERRGGDGRIPPKKRKLARSGSGGSERSRGSPGIDSIVKSQLLAAQQWQQCRRGGSKGGGPKSPFCFTDDDGGAHQAHPCPGTSDGSKNMHAAKASEPKKKRRRQRIVTSDSDDSDDSDYEEGGIVKKKRGRTGEARAPRRKRHVSVPLGVEIGDRKGLKPSLKVGDAVYGAWWPDASRRRASEHLFGPMTF